MCKCMRVSRSSYYNWFKKKDLKSEITATEQLMARIKFIFNESKQIYGSYRVQKKLEREGLFYSRSYVGLLMTRMGLRSILKRKFMVTTDSNHSFPIADNVLDRNFTSTKLGEKWVSDITYIRVKDDWEYLTTIIDLADKKVVGWSLSSDMTVANTIMKAWLMARTYRDVVDGFVFHSDRGVQYASNKITALFYHSKKITQSMSRKGNCWDNAVAESFFKTIKYEALYRYKFESSEQLYDCVNEYINWYNTSRLHSSLGYLTPLEKEIELRGIINKAA